MSKNQKDIQQGYCWWLLVKTTQFVVKRFIQIGNTKMFFPSFRSDEKAHFIDYLTSTTSMYQSTSCYLLVT